MVQHESMSRRRKIHHIEDCIKEYKTHHYPQPLISKEKLSTSAL